MLPICDAANQHLVRAVGVALDRMKILVAIKQVPERDATLAVEGAGIDERDLAWTMNEPDAYALEEALQLREKHGGEVVVLSVGPERVASTLREALAKGADRAIHILAEDGGSRDVLSIGRLLADAVRGESPDLILTGLQSEDLGLGQTGVVLAELLGIPHAAIVLQVEVLTPTRIKVKRELEDGWFQHVEMPLPTLLTIQSGGNKLRYATLMGIKKAKSKETRTVEAAASTAVPVNEVVRVYVPAKQKHTEMLGGTTAEIATKLTEILRSEVGVL
jgi:electron transfer flavoprotein beta subunit